MASSTTPRVAKAVDSVSQELAAVSGFPQLDRRNSFSDDRWRALYARATNNRLWFRVLNQRYIKARRELAAPKVTPAGKRVARDLHANGIAFADFSEFFSPQCLDALQERFCGYLEAFNRANATAKSQKGKAVFLDTLHKAHTFVPDDPVSAYLSEPMFAAIAARYMGMVPRFVGSSFWHTREAKDGDRLYSQTWHRDYNDRMLVKAFLYLSDVGDQEGYFEYVTGSHGRGPLGRGYDRIGSDGFRAYPDSDEVERRMADLPIVSLDGVPSDRRSGDAAPWHGTPTIVRCLAPKATLIFADTFGLHRGGFVRSGYRDMIMTTYSTNFNIHKPHFAVTEDFTKGLTPFMRMAFGLA